MKSQGGSGGPLGKQNILFTYGLVVKSDVLKLAPFFVTDGLVWLKTKGLLAPAFIYL